MEDRFEEEFNMYGLRQTTWTREPRCLARMLGAAVVAICLVMAGPAFAQSVLTLEDFDMGAGTGQAGSSREIETCLLDKARCTSSDYKTSAKISLDDMVNLGVIDHEESAASVKASASGGSQQINSAEALPSIDMEILFDYNSATMRDDQIAKLAELSATLGGEKFNHFRFGFLGHTDAKGSTDYNQVLSFQRAQAVADFLRSNTGLRSQRIVVAGLGSSRLKVSSDPFSEKNRRVQIVLFPAD